MMNLDILTSKRGWDNILMLSTAFLGKFAESRAQTIYITVCNEKTYPPER